MWRFVCFVLYVEFEVFGFGGFDDWRSFIFLILERSANVNHVSLPMMGWVYIWQGVLTNVT